MMFSNRFIALATAVFLLSTGSANANHHTGANSASTQTRSALTQLLQVFLKGASYGDKDAHERFWHEDLIYTSSNGTRTTKQLIVGGIADTGDAPVEEPASLFSADDIQIRVLNKTTAVVAFKLIATPNTASKTPAPASRFYLNTGTFVYEKGAWRAIAWQATTMAEANTQ